MFRQSLAMRAALTQTRKSLLLVSSNGDEDLCIEALLDQAAKGVKKLRTPEQDEQRKKSLFLKKAQQALELPSKPSMMFTQPSSYQPKTSIAGKGTASRESSTGESEISSTDSIMAAIRATYGEQLAEPLLGDEEEGGAGGLSVGAASNALIDPRRQEEEETAETIAEAVVRGLARQVDQFLLNHTPNEWEVIEERSPLDGKNLLHLAAEHGHVGILNHFTKHTTKKTVDRRDHAGWTPLQLAIRSGHWPAAKVLINAGAKPSLKAPSPSASSRQEKHDDGKINRNLSTSVLDMVIQAKNYELVPLLVDENARVNPLESFGPAVAEAIAYAASRPISESYASSKKRAPQVILDPTVLAEYNLKLAQEEERAREYGQNYYSSLKSIKKYVLLEKLIEGGCSINAMDVQGNTALHYACSRGDGLMVEALVSRGAKIDAVNERGQTPLHLVSAKLQPLKKIQILLEADQRTMDEATEKNNDCRTAAIRKPAYLDIQDYRGWTPLHCFVSWPLGDCGKSAFTLVHELLDAGASLNLKEENGFTPLDLAQKQPDHLLFKSKIIDLIESSQTGGEGESKTLLVI